MVSNLGLEKSQIPEQESKKSVKIKPELRPIFTQAKIVQLEKDISNIKAWLAQKELIDQSQGALTRKKLQAEESKLEKLTKKFSVGVEEIVNDAGGNLENAEDLMTLLKTIIKDRTITEKLLAKAETSERYADEILMTAAEIQETEEAENKKQEEAWVKSQLKQIRGLNRLFNRKETFNEDEYLKYTADAIKDVYRDKQARFFSLADRSSAQVENLNKQIEVAEGKDKKTLMREKNRFALQAVAFETRATDLINDDQLLAAKFLNENTVREIADIEHLEIKDEVAKWLAAAFVDVKGMSRAKIEAFEADVRELLRTDKVDPYKATEEQIKDAVVEVEDIWSERDGGLKNLIKVWRRSTETESYKVLQRPKESEVVEAKKDIHQARKKGELKKTNAKEKEFLGLVSDYSGQMPLDQATAKAQRIASLPQEDLKQIMATGRIDSLANKYQAKAKADRENYYDILSLMKENEAEVYQILSLSQDKIAQIKKLPEGFDGYLASAEFKKLKKTLDNWSKSELKATLAEYKKRFKLMKNNPWRPGPEDTAKFLPSIKEKVADKIEKIEQTFPSSIEINQEMQTDLRSMVKKMPTEKIYHYLKQHFYIDMAKLTQVDREVIEKLESENKFFRAYYREYKRRMTDLPDFAPRAKKATIEEKKQSFTKSETPSEKSERMNFFGEIFQRQFDRLPTAKLMEYSKLVLKKNESQKQDISAEEFNEICQSAADEILAVKPKKSLFSKLAFWKK